MDRKLYNYCLGLKIRPWSSKVGRRVSRLISGALRTGVPEDGDLLSLLRESLADSETLCNSVFRRLAPLHGCGGSEGYVLDVDDATEAEFWACLAEKFPNHQGLAYLAADAGLLAGNEASARRFFTRGFRLDPNTQPPVAVDWEDVLRGTEWHLEYRLHMLIETRREYPEELAEEVDELTSEYGDAPDKLKIIHDVANGGEMPHST
jgi:hypothetical protein